MTTTDLAPKGEMVLRTSGNAGGYQCQRGYFWRLADVADGYWRRHYGQRDRPGRVVTVRVDGMTFLRPVAVGDVVCCYARCVKRGNTSVTINIEVWVKKVSSEPIGQRYKATEALFIYVAVDNQGKPRPLPAE
ncbi:acyl-CoA thioester hydrolase YciA [Klebsiella pneumoniae]|nr:acyl-CoA thioester hydrolase YciA [Klebsiella pneumoniae]